MYDYDTYEGFRMRGTADGEPVVAVIGEYDWGTDGLYVDVVGGPSVLVTPTRVDLPIGGDGQEWVGTEGNREYRLTFDPTYVP